MPTFSFVNYSVHTDQIYSADGMNYKKELNSICSFPHSRV